MIARRLLILGLLGLGGCQPFMDDQPKNKSYSVSNVFADGSSARPPVEGTRTYLAHAQSRPRLSPELMQEGHTRFEIHCAVCHDSLGQGRGMAVQRGFPAPPSWHNESNRRLTDAQIYGAISEGFGTMPGFAAVLTPLQRWAVVAYIRALQLSQHFPRRHLSAEDLARTDRGETRD